MNRSVSDLPSVVNVRLNVGPETNGGFVDFSEEHPIEATSAMTVRVARAKRRDRGMDSSLAVGERRAAGNAFMVRQASKRCQ
jgi:hypothetical protein